MVSRVAFIIREEKKLVILSKLIAWIERVGVRISAIFIFAMMILTTIDVISRYLLNSPLRGNFELQSMLLIAVIYLGLSFVQSQRAHIKMEALTTKLPMTSQNFLQLFGDTLFLFIAAIITWQMGLQAWQAWATGEYYWSLIHFPLWPAKSVITLGTGLLCLRLILGIIENPLWRTQPGVKKSNRYIGIIGLIMLFVFISAGVLIANNIDLGAPTIGWISIGVFFILLLLGTPIAGSMILIGIMGIWLMIGGRAALGIAATVPFSAASEYTMTVLPLFIIMGFFANLAGFPAHGFILARRWLEGITGGIIHATVLGSVAFASASGSSIAACAVLGKVAIPEMIRQGVKKNVAIGVVASAAPLAVMIPPSGQFVVYGMITGNSIGQLLIAGIIPGLVGAAILMVSIYIRCKLDPSIIRPIATTRASWKERFSAIPHAWGLMFIAITVLGGIYIGIFTPTEAGALGAFVAFLGIFISKKGNIREIFQVLLESGASSSSVVFILVGGVTFGYMISLTQFPTIASEWIASLNVEPIFVLICILMMYIVLGCFKDTLSTMIITMPVVYPIIISLGFDPIWFGVLMVQVSEIGVITPPFGMNLFVIKGILPETPLGEIFRGVAFFIIPVVVTLVIYVAFPQLALWLPGMMVK